MTDSPNHPIRRAFVPLLLAVLTTVAAGQLPATSHRVSVTTLLSTDRVPSGGTVRVAVTLSIDEGWHINSSRPTSDYLIPTTLQFTARGDMIVAGVSYPAGKKVKLAFEETPLDVYDGKTTIFATLKLSEKFPRGADTLRGTVEAQACNNQTCLPPSAIPVAIPVTVVEPGTAVSQINADVFSADVPQTAGTSASNDLATMIQERGTLVYFLAIFLIGLALNLTPCVYPMLSVTVSIFGAQSETRVGRVALKAVVYVLGIASMYSVLGVTAALGGGLFGSLLQSPWVLGGIAALLFGLALSSFGLYQITMPYWLTSRLGGATGTGLLTVYISGLVVGVFAAPCVGPPVIALMAFVGSKADPLFGFWSFFALSLGLGLPYLILGTFSGLLRKIPKSGSWLEWVERIFGVVLTGAALFYLSLAIAPKASAYVVPATLIFGGAYLGFIDRSGRGKPLLRKIQWATGVVAILLGAWFVRGLQKEGIRWEPFSEARLFEAQGRGTPVVIDFYADWCIPCLELDRSTFTDPEVADVTSGLVRLKVDMTHFDSPESDAMRKKFGIAGVPTVVFLRGDGTEAVDARIVGFVPPKDFVERVKKVARRSGD